MSLPALSHRDPRGGLDAPRWDPEPECVDATQGHRTMARGVLDRRTTRYRTQRPRHASPLPENPITPGSDGLRRWSPNLLSLVAKRTAPHGPVMEGDTVLATISSSTDRAFATRAWANSMIRSEAPAPRYAPSSPRHPIRRGGRQWSAPSRSPADCAVISPRGCPWRASTVSC